MGTGTVADGDWSWDVCISALMDGEKFFLVIVIQSRLVEQVVTNIVINPTLHFAVHRPR